MRRMAVKATAIAIAFATFTGVGSSYDPPPGSELPPIWGSPSILGGSSITVPDPAPSTIALNPAANAFEQRVTLEMSYAGLLGLGSVDGWGSVINLAMTIPQPYGVWATALQFVSMPATFQDPLALPLGTFLTARGAFSKELGGGLAFGIGLQATFGTNVTSDWGLAADLGIVKKEGSVGFLKDFSWGIALTNFGKPFSPQAPGASSGYPSPFTMSVGAAGNLVDSGDFKLRASMDLSFPTFQNLLFDAGLAMSYGGFIGIDLGWRFNLVETLSGAPVSYLPSFGIWGTIPLSLDSGEGTVIDESWKRSDLVPFVAAAPAPAGVWGILLGAKLPLGVVDREGPEITLGYEAEKPAWVSPNNDGKADVLVIPLKIDDARYVASWTFEIRNEKGEVVRTIANKETRPEMLGDGSIFDAFLYVKKGVAVPAELEWNCTDDSGAPVPDGAYFFVVRAVDDNGNSSERGPFPLHVDATAPTSSLKAADPTLTFSPDGDGSKDTFLVKMESSIEDRWTITVEDAAGIVARTVVVDSAALSDWAWDGLSDSGAVVPDGVYSVTVTATDRAQNSRRETLANIIVNTAKPTLDVALDGAAFSPNGDGSRDALKLAVKLSSYSGVKDWKLVALDAKGNEIWSVGRTEVSPAPPASVAVTGLGPTGAAWPEGTYRIAIVVDYVNGFRATAESPSFVLDLTPPKATVSADRPAFNPAGEAARASVTFAQSGSEEVAWKGEVIDKDGKVVKTFRFEGAPDAAVAWDGTNDDGRVVPDGSYRYRLSSTDRAGNSGASSFATVLVDTEKKAVILSPDIRAFSPNGDGVRDVARLIPQVAGNERVESWKLELRIGPLVAKTWQGKGPVPASFAWDGKGDDGKLAADGEYVATIAVRYVTGEPADATANAILLDTVAPSIEISAAPLLFSPDGDGRKDALVVAQRSTPGDAWEGRILDAAGRAVRTWTWKNAAADFSWDGKDDAGNVAPDGAYRYVVSSVDAAGNKTERALAGIAIDTRAPRIFLTASRAGFSPNGDGQFDDLRFGLVVPDRAGIESWKLVLADANGAPRKTWRGGAADAIPASLAWDGKGDDGMVAQGLYSASFEVLYAHGALPVALAGPLALDTEGPKLKVATSPALFSPDNDGIDDELVFAIGVEDPSLVEKWTLVITEAEASDSGKAREKTLMTFSGTGRPTETIKWDGRSTKGETVESATDYPYYLTVTDVWGNTTIHRGTVSTDVLIIKEGDNLRIKVPSIVFRPGFADFVNLPKDRVDRNMTTIARIATILNRFTDYRIVVQGHAINTAKYANKSAAEIERVEKAETIPVSLQRAQEVVRLLVAAGVSPSRLQAVGVGSSMPVVPYTDDANLWKNRRVEFILIKR